MKVLTDRQFLILERAAKLSVAEAGYFALNSMGTCNVTIDAAHESFLPTKGDLARRCDAPSLRYGYAAVERLIHRGLLRADRKNGRAYQCTLTYAGWVALDQANQCSP